MKPNLNKLQQLARQMTVRPEGDKGFHARRAFDLAHRARRLLESAAEAASRDRWNELERPAKQPKENVARFATACAEACIKYPITGEAKVYAALLDAVDTATLVADELYKAWLKTQPRSKPLPVPDGGVNRLGGPMAPGCARVSFDQSDDDLSSGG